MEDPKLEPTSQPQGNDDKGTQPYKTFNSKAELTNYINQALSNKNNDIQSLRNEINEIKYQNTFSEFPTELSSLLIKQIDYSKSNDEINNQIVSLKEKYASYADQEKLGAISNKKEFKEKTPKSKDNDKEEAIKKWKEAIKNSNF